MPAGSNTHASAEATTADTADSTIAATNRTAEASLIPQLPLHIISIANEGIKLSNKKRYAESVAKISDAIRQAEELIQQQQQQQQQHDLSKTATEAPTTTAAVTLPLSWLRHRASAYVRLHRFAEAETDAR